jgi:hypothetical protein
VTLSVKRGEIAHSSKPGSACSNTEPGASGTDFQTAAPLPPPDPGSQPSPHSTMLRSKVDTPGQAGVGQSSLPELQPEIRDADLNHRQNLLRGTQTYRPVRLGEHANSPLTARCFYDLCCSGIAQVERFKMFVGHWFGWCRVSCGAIRWPRSATGQGLWNSNPANIGASFSMSSSSTLVTVRRVRCRAGGSWSDSTVIGSPVSSRAHSTGRKSL